MNIHTLKMKVAQSCLTLFDPMDYTVHGIIQPRILEWVAYPFSVSYVPYKYCSIAKHTEFSNFKKNKEK